MIIKFIQSCIIIFAILLINSETRAAIYWYQGGDPALATSWASSSPYAGQPSNLAVYYSFKTFLTVNAGDKLIMKDIYNSTMTFGGICITNYGTVDVDDVTLYCVGPAVITNYSGTVNILNHVIIQQNIVLNGGTLNIGNATTPSLLEYDMVSGYMFTSSNNNSIINVAPSSSLKLTNASVDLNINTTFNNNGSVIFPCSTSPMNATLTGTGTYSTSCNGAFSMAQGANVISPGNSPGIIQFNSPLTLDANEVINIEIGGTNAGTQYDVLGGTGSKTLGGTLNINFINGFIPSNVDIFNIVTGSAVNGTFSTINISSLPSNYSWSVTYTPTSLKINVTNSSALSIDFLSFDVMSDYHSALLNWTIMNEKGIESYQVEKSIDGKVFETIGTTEAQNKNDKCNYAFKDHNPYGGLNFYRIKQIDQKGNATYSNTKSINHIDQIQSNPIFVNSNSQLIIKNINDECQYTIFDINGNTIMSGKLENQKPIQISSFPSGIYVIQTYHKGQRTIHKFSKI